MRQWVLSFPYPLRFLFAARPEVMGKLLAIVYRAIATHLIGKAGLTRDTLLGRMSFSAATAIRARHA